MYKMFETIFDSGVIGVGDYVIALVAALITGVVIAIAYMIKNQYSKSFVVTLSLLPSIVAAVIMMVNGNIGAGVAVAGAFSLVRFRSVPGTAREICAIFLAMAVGLSMGMGYVGYGVLLAIILCVVNVILNLTPFGEKKVDKCKKTLKITIPEELDYTDVFDDLFSEYLKAYDLMQVKSTNMGSMFKLTYDVVLKDAGVEKEFIDKLRCRNGNLEIVMSRVQMNLYEQL